MSASQPTRFPAPSAVARTRAFVARVLWTALPFGSLGILGWLPALRVARRRRTRAAWLWLAGLAGSAVVECVLVAVVPSKGHDDAGAAAGGFVVTSIITASVYTWTSGGDMRRPPLPLPYPGPATAWMPAPFGDTPGTPLPAMPIPATPVPVMPPIPARPPAAAAAAVAAAPDMAAEVQAELRELRGLLGGGDAR